MDEKKIFKHRFSSIVWGILLIWWGIVVMFDPLTIAIGAIGTGLIFLAANLILSLRGIPTKASNTQFGIIAITWGILDQVRHVLALPLSVSFALILIIYGIVALLSPLFSHLQSNQQPGSV